MKILEIELKDFGPHKMVDRTFTDSIVGLLGKNGSGKSNFLEAIEWLMTGYTKANAVTYIRNGTKKAQGRMKFQSKGCVGEIERVITKSGSKRVLTWEGETYTKAAEVDSIMSEIIGADKFVMNNAIFIRQGTLDKLLFGTDTERKEMFIKLLTVGWVDHIGDKVEGRIKKLSKGIEDLSGIYDDLRQQEKDVTTDIEGLSASLSSIPNYDTELTWIKDFSHATITSKESILGEERHAQLVADTNKKLEDNLSRRAYKDVEEAIIDAAETQKAYTVISKEYSDLLQQDKFRAAYVHTLEARKKAEKDLEDVEAEIKALRVYTDEERESITKQMSDLDSYNSAKAGADKLKIELNDAMDKLKSWEDYIVPDIENLPMYESEIENLTNKRVMISTTYNVLNDVLTKTHSGTDCCPVCQEHIDPSVLSQERVDGLRNEVSNLTNQISELKSKVNTIAESKRTKDENILILTNNRDDITYKVQVFLKVIIEFAALDKDKILADYAAMNSTGQGLTKLNEKKSTIESTLSGHKNVLANMQLESMWDRRDEDNTTRLKELETLVQTKEAKAEDVRVFVAQHITPFTNELKQRTGAYEQAVTAKEQAAKRLSTLNVSRPSTLDSPEFDLESEPLIALLKEKNSKYDLVKGKIEQANKTAKDLQNRIDELTTRMAKDKITRMIIEELTEVRKVCHRDGLPMRYVDYQFNRLTDAAQENLNVMETDFVVKSNFDKPVTFSFYRSGEGPDHLMDQEKLSGGQKVKFTVAFLMAIQQLIVPDVGFLVLDEPSCHLDQEAIDDVKDLLQGLGARLENSDSQTWVADHHPTLISSFRDVIITDPK